MQIVLLSVFLFPSPLPTETKQPTKPVLCCRLHLNAAAHSCMHLSSTQQTTSPLYAIYYFVVFLLPHLLSVYRLLIKILLSSSSSSSLMQAAQYTMFVLCNKLNWLRYSTQFSFLFLSFQILSSLLLQQLPTLQQFPSQLPLLPRLLLSLLLC